MVTGGNSQSRASETAWRMPSSLDAIHPRRMPASEKALDMDPVAMVFSYPSDKIDGGASSPESRLW